MASRLGLMPIGLIISKYSCKSEEHPPECGVGQEDLRAQAQLCPYSVITGKSRPFAVKAGAGGAPQEVL